MPSSLPLPQELAKHKFFKRLKYVSRVEKEPLNVWSDHEVEMLLLGVISLENLGFELD